MSKIGACLWFEDSAEEAAAFHTSVFSHSRITAVTRYTTAGQEFHGRPPGSVMTVAYEIDGFSFTALNGGPHFAPNPSVSFFVRCEREEQVDRLWELLSPEGSVLMTLGADQPPDREGTVMYGECRLAGQTVIAMDSAVPGVCGAVFWLMS